MARTAILLFLAVSLPQTCIAAVTFDWAYVGNAGNASDPQTSYGAVPYRYAIGKHEVTNAQYVDFLNAAAATDSFSLYSESMGSDPRGGIARSGAPGSYSYATKPNMADKPVIYVSFFDAMRFTNWLHNGQGSGDTETGAYTIGNGYDEVRSGGAKYWIPSEDEWYKAAYHDASAGTEGVYFDFATGSDGVPTIAMANSVGDISNPGMGVVNYAQGAKWNGQNGNATTVGSAGIASASPYGTFDQSGNVWEWNEAVISSDFRGVRGGSWGGFLDNLPSEVQNVGEPYAHFSNAGFRVATGAPATGDYNADGTVDQSDYDLWASQFRGTQPNAGFGADGNGDGVVDAADYTVWRDAFEATTATAIPEPTALALAAMLAGWGVMGRRDRRRR